MVYKGEAFDLRAQMGWTDAFAPGRPTYPGPAQWRSAGAHLNPRLPASEPLSSLWVDDSLLACFTRAQELAAAQASAHISVAHLLQAMTLVEPAARVLHAYNIDIAGLRQDSAAAAAADGSVGHEVPGAPPIPSPDLDGLLRLAAERAHAQRSLVTTSALLDTIFDMKRETTHRNLLARNRIDWDLRTGPEPRERVRVSAGSHQLGHGGNPDVVPTQTDTMQNTRIDSLERAVRELSDDLAMNRKAFATMVDEIRDSRPGGVSGQGLYVGNGNATSYPDMTAETLELDHDHIIDRLHLIERNVDTKFDELARTWTVLGRRLDAMEQAIGARAGVDGAGLSPDVSDKIAAIPDLMAALENKLGDVDGPGIGERLSAMERRLLGSNSARFGIPAELNGKLDKIDGAFTALIERLDALEENFGQPGDGNWDAIPITAGLKEIEAKAGDTQLMIDTVDDRVRKVEDLLDSQRGQLAQVSSTLGTELKALTASVSAQGVGGERMGALIEDGMRGVAQTFEHQKTEIAATVSNEVADRIDRLIDMMEERQNEQSRILSALSDRVGGQPGENDQVVRMAEAYMRDSGALHEALRAINANQQRLASSMDNWHSEARNDSAEMTNRLRSLEGGSLSGEGGELKRIYDEVGELRDTVQDQRRSVWSRFRIWLYGTDDWYGASWGDNRRGNDVEA